MPEPTSFGTGATIAAAVGAGTGAVAVPVLAAFGIDGYSVGAGLLGCVVAQIFSPPERVTVLRMTLTAVGSVLVASFGAPYISALFEVGTVTKEHAHAVASAILGGGAKPAYLMARARWEAWLAARLPPADSKGPHDA